MVAFAGPAMAAEVTVKISDVDQQAFGNLPVAVDQCVAGLTLRGDAQVCKLIAQFAAEFGAKVEAAAPPAAAEPAK
jgi:hypothetical protein